MILLAFLIFVPALEGAELNQNRAGILSLHGLPVLIAYSLAGVLGLRGECLRSLMRVPPISEYS